MWGDFMINRCTFCGLWANAFIVDLTVANKTPAEALNLTLKKVNSKRRLGKPELTLNTTKKTINSKFPKLTSKIAKIYSREVRCN